MKIYILPIDAVFQPATQPFRYPAHNANYGLEEDFHQFLLRNPALTVDEPAQADWHYLPIYWRRYFLNHDYGRGGLDVLQAEIGRKLINDTKTFTVYQYAGQPLVDLGHTITYLGSRHEPGDTDLPLVCSPHKLPLRYRFPFTTPSKKYLASFIGRLSTHPIRQEMADRIGSRSDIHIVERVKGTRYFVRTMLRSHIALCPRGYGAASYRTYEAMQLGTVPLLLGDMDVRPFKTQVDWDAVSFSLTTVDELVELLATIKIETLETMGKQAQHVWHTQLYYQKWCQLLLNELEANYG